MAIKHTTDLDLRLAAAFYSILVQMAREGRGGPATQLNYDLLRQFAKLEHPSLANEIDACTNQMVGRRLEFVRRFTEAKGYPDITALIVNKNTGEVGSGYIGNPQQARTDIAKFDWSKVAPEFDLYIADLKKSVKRKKVMTPKEAKTLIVAYAKAKGIKSNNSGALPRLMDFVLEGTPIEEAFDLVLGPNPQSPA